MFGEEYIVDVSADPVNEILHLKAIHNDNFGKDLLPPHENLEGLFPNVCGAFRIFCTLPVSVAGAERSFGGLTILTNAFGQHQICLVQICCKYELCTALHTVQVWQWPNLPVFVQIRPLSPLHWL